MARETLSIVRVDARRNAAAAREALDLVLRLLPADVREPFADAMLTSASLDEEALAELWRAERPEDGSLQGATWGQLRPGSTAVVWPPQWRLETPPSSPDKLLTALLASLAERNVTLAQSLLPNRDVPEASTLTGCGFEHLAELTYLFAPAPADAAPRADVDFVPAAENELPRLADLVERTYVATMDCPSLNGLRPARDVVDEYLSIGDCRAALWRFVRFGGREVGCLLLADHSALDQLELVYMGIVPEARGSGLGEVVVGEALRMTAAQGRGRVVLAVDAANTVALSVYRRAGFTAWETRSVFIRRLGAAAAD